MSSEPTSTTADGTPPDRTRLVDTLVARAMRHTTLEEEIRRALGPGSGRDPMGLTAALLHATRFANRAGLPPREVRDFVGRLLRSIVHADDGIANPDVAERLALSCIRFVDAVYFRLGERGLVADPAAVIREVGVVAVDRHAEWDR
jgi:hypothetical protein